MYDGYYKSFVFQEANAKNPNGQGYMRVKLKLKDGTWKRFLVHRLVAAAFIQNDDPEHKKYVNHINGNPECNLVINLEWCNAYDNNMHAIMTNLLHSNNFSSNIRDIESRMESVVCWIIAICHYGMKSAFIILREYVKHYEKNLIIFETEEEFLSWVNQHKKESPDFNRLISSYEEWITDKRNKV